jgi:hypothetical protein
MSRHRHTGYVLPSPGWDSPQPVFHTPASADLGVITRTTNNTNDWVYAEYAKQTKEAVEKESPVWKYLSGRKP